MHVPVLLNEVIKVMQPKAGEIFVDGTFGGGGHAVEILNRLGPSGRFIGIDADESAIKDGKKQCEAMKQCELIHGNYADIQTVLEDRNIARVDGLLIDLGFSSMQIDDETRGFSFKFKDALLDMNYGMGGENAEIILNTWNEKSLLSIFKKFGEERYSGRIARKIVHERKKKRIRTVGDLIDIIERVVPHRKKIITNSQRRSGIHPATRIFQALRIAVNDELENINTILGVLPEIMNPGGRVAIISFHSLEDREVKVHFRALAESGIVDIITKKPITPSIGEMEENPRSRSAKLRAIVFHT